MKEYTILINNLLVDDNAPCYAKMLLNGNENFDTIVLNSAYDYEKEPDKFLDDIFEQISDLITYDIENEVEIYNLELEFEILGVK